MPRALTNLENVALAHLWRLGSCTAHELRQAFASSSAGRYSGSPGAIYPLMKRLEGAELVISKPDANGAQKKRVYSITRSGRRAVKGWMNELEARSIFPDDPLRTRFQYLKLLTRKERIEWINSALEALDRQDALTRLEYQSDEYQNPIDQYILDGILKTNRLRRSWLSRAADIVQEIT